ncbi:hypothetical protein A4A49_33160 [Nicotiana attenuata]|uniref:Uncharacterized protein n=1 Tax=Nicotiana attenuata TaxID=49451 RepID=A0A314LIH6_NICAT|nr:hypothetical protein A4A49_33160 [Nicotiana attenuata]
MELSSVCPVPAVASSCSSMGPTSSAPAPLLLASNATGKLDSGSDKGTFSCSSAISGHDDSLCDSSILKNIGQGDSGVGTGHTSDAVPPLPAISSVSSIALLPLHLSQVEDEDASLKLEVSHHGAGGRDRI